MSKLHIGFSRALHIEDQIFVLVLISFSVITACDFDKSHPSDNEILEIEARLEKLAVENLKDWEPPFHVDKFLQDFTQSIDFRFTVDGFHVDDFKKWESLVYESMEFDRRNHKQYIHDIVDIQTIVLGENSGLVTINYIWDYITNENLHYHTPATVTTVYRLEKDNWKIINSHVSHGEKRLVKEYQLFISYLET